MIDQPERWASGYAEAGAYNVTFHVEATDDPIAVAKDIRGAGAKAGMALKPGTSLNSYLDIISDFDTILITSVEPGFGGLINTDILEDIDQHVTGFTHHGIILAAEMAAKTTILNNDDHVSRENLITALKDRKTRFYTTVTV